MLAADKLWDRVEETLKHSQFTLLYGPAGTGKTTIGFSNGNRDALAISLHDETTVAELIGHFIPLGDRFVWQDGPALAAWRQGKRLILDEIDLASGGVLSVLRVILNNPDVAALTIPNQAMAGMSDSEVSECILAGEGLETVRPTKGFNVVAMMNGQPEDLDVPLFNRFTAHYYIPTPHPRAIAALPEDLRKAALATVTQEGPRWIGLRTWKSFGELRIPLGEEAAAEAVFGPRANDVMDGLNLARPSAPAKLAAVPAEAPAESADKSTWPTSYFVKTGAKGRPPLVVCEAHGKMTHRTSTETNGEIRCDSCGRVAAPANKWKARVLNPDSKKWEDR